MAARVPRAGAGGVPPPVCGGVEMMLRVGFAGLEAPPTKRVLRKLPWSGDFPGNKIMITKS